MTARIDLFRTLSNTLDDVVRRVDEDLPTAEDIHPAIAKIGAYAAEQVSLPVALAKLEAQKASAEASVPARDKAVRQARHAVVTLEAKLKKLGESIDRNRAAAATEEPAPKVAATGFAATLPATRLDLVERLLKEFLAAEEGLAKAQGALKRMEALRKGVDTRTANLTKKIAATVRAIAEHDGRLEETFKILRKTISHLKNRQQKRDRRRKQKTSTVPGFENPDGSPIEFVDVELKARKAPTDEDILKMAESAGIAIDGPDDLETARQLFLN